MPAVAMAPHLTQAGPHARRVWTGELTPPADDLTAHQAPVKPHERQYRYYDFFMAAYVCILLCAHLIGPAKVSTVYVPIIGNVTFLAGVLFFPLSYIFGDILREVYGYARDRRGGWGGVGGVGVSGLVGAGLR